MHDRPLVSNLHEALWAAFHRVWTAAVGTAGYEKAAWTALEREILKAKREAHVHSCEFVKIGRHVIRVASVTLVTLQAEASGGVHIFFVGDPEPLKLSGVNAEAARAFFGPGEPSTSCLGMTTDITPKS